MVARGTVEVCGLNLNASPHPEGVYIAALRGGSRLLVRARASDFAKISSPRKYERVDHLYTGRISIWTDIDITGRWIDLSKEEELSPDIKSLISIPQNARPNYRTFNYVCDDKRHHLWFETRNEFGDSLGPTTAKHVFAELLSQEHRGLDEPEITVTIIPEEGAVERILGMPRLKSLIIRVVRPNPDVSSPSARRRVLGVLEESHARQLELRFTKAPEAQKLTPTPYFREFAEVGNDTGFVRGEATDGDGGKVVLSTDGRPRRLRVDMDSGPSFVSRLLSVLHL
jgi:hypothetical protein